MRHGSKVAIVAVYLYTLREPRVRKAALRRLYHIAVFQVAVIPERQDHLAAPTLRELLRKAH
jgi:hypothetical protein